MRRDRIWLFIAAALFVAAAWLMSRGDEPRREVAKVEFPRHLRPAEWKRMEERRTLALPPRPIAASDPAAPEPEREVPLRDPVLAALPALAGRSAVVLEANALRHAPIGELLLECFFGSDGDRQALEEFRQELGFDPLEDIDRIAMGGEGVAIVSGHFGGARWEELGAIVTVEPWGERARFYLQGESGDALAVWGDELLLWGDDRAAVERAIDRLEGRAAAEPAITEHETYGEIYGVLAAAQLAELIPEETGLRHRLIEAAERIELHVDASADVAIAATVEGKAADQVLDLGRSLGAALSLGRLKARAEGNEKLVELLDHARVDTMGDRFAVELALPLPLLEKHLREACGPRMAATEPPSEPIE